MSDDSNRDLAPFVEGMVMGLLDQRAFGELPGGWKGELDSDPNGVHALYFISPSGIRWRIRAEIEEPPPPEKPRGHAAGVTKAAGW